MEINKNEFKVPAMNATKSHKVDIIHEIQKYHPNFNSNTP